jgi:hypothetical protein
MGVAYRTGAMQNLGCDFGEWSEGELRAMEKQRNSSSRCFAVNLPRRAARNGVIGGLESNLSDLVMLLVLLCPLHLFSSNLNRKVVTVNTRTLFPRARQFQLYMGSTGSLCPEG